MKKTHEEILAELMEDDDPYDDDIALANEEERKQLARDKMFQTQLDEKDISNAFLYKAMNNLIEEQKSTNYLLKSIQSMVKFFAIVMTVSLCVLAVYIMLLMGSL